MRNLVDQQSDQILQLLKGGTRDIHERTERRISIFEPDFNLVQYVQLVERFYGFWAPLEAKLSNEEILRHPALNLQARLKSDLLEADLLVFGRNPAEAPRCSRLPAVDSFSRCLGCLYVLEGSTLGGRAISRRIEMHLNVRDKSGASFFNAYGESVGRRWSEFTAFLATYAACGEYEEIVASARETFDCFFEWLDEFPIDPN